MSAVPVAVPSTVKSPLAGTNILVEGPTGTGKTTSLKTLAETGLEVFVLFTENGLETLLGAWKDVGAEVPANVHWHVLEAPKEKFSAMADMARMVNTMGMESLAKIADPNRSKYTQFYQLLTVLSDFEDQRTGKKFGPVDSWGTGRVLAVDGFTNLCFSAMSNVIGGKVMRSQADWGLAQNLIENLVRQLTDGCRCHFVLLAHIEREIDQVLGGIKLTVSTLGRALAPKIPPMFSDVVLSYREGQNFLWSTDNSQADLKARNLPIKNGLAQDFTQIMSKWKSRGGLFE